jgi:crotonobetainyl-CoA:carnitine CoA-transferase CaiB-like acyl-CoA transferase
VDLERHPQPVPKGAAPRGAHTAEVRAEADAIPAAALSATALPKADNSNKRGAHSELAAELSAAFLARPATTWFSELDAAGVPCEISDPDYALRLFADRAAEERGWTASFQHRMVGKMKLGGLTFDLSGTPAALRGGPLWPGQDSKAILADLGYTDDEIAKLLESKAVDDTSEA